MEHRISDEFGWCEICGGNPLNDSLPPDCPERVLELWEKKKIQDGHTGTSTGANSWLRERSGRDKCA